MDCRGAVRHWVPTTSNYYQSMFHSYLRNLSHFLFFHSIICSLTSLPGLDGPFLFSMLLAMKAHAKLYITHRNALVLAALMGKVVSDAGLSYRN